MTARKGKSTKGSRPPHTRALGWMIDADLFTAFTTLCDQRGFTYRRTCESAFTVFMHMSKDIQRDAYDDPNDPEFVKSLDEAMQQMEARRTQR